MAFLVPIFRDDQIVNLLDWATQLAAAEGQSLEIIWCVSSRDGKGKLIEKSSDDEDLPKELFPKLEDLWARYPILESEGHKATVYYLKSRALFHSLLGVTRERSPEMVILGKSFSSKSENAPVAAKVAVKLYEKVSCDVILFRLTDGECGACDSILIPVGGGENSRKALRLADNLTRLHAGTMTPLFVQPNSDDVAEEVGDHILRAAIKRARVKEPFREEVKPKTLVRDNVIKAIRDEVAVDDYDLVLIGGANTTTLRQKLFGTIPDKLIGGEDGVTMGVVRRAFPLKERIKRAAGRLLSLSVPQLTREDRVALFENLQTKSRWSFDFMALIILSTAIAALGLTQNSPAVIIGAMLVAPLMTPLLGSGLALVQGNAPLMRDSAKAITLGFLCAVVIGALMGFLVKPFTGLTPEMLSRGGPSLLDMGVGFLSGIAAAYCLARPGLSSALAGVAIAAALVPPIATVGMSLSLGDADNAKGAGLLFGTNVVAIILGAAVSFFLAGIRGRKNAESSLWVRRILALLVLCLAILAIPLGSVIVAKISDARKAVTQVQLRSLLDARLEKLVPGTYLRKAPSIRNEGDGRIMELYVAAPEVPSRDTVNLLKGLVKKELGQDVKIRLFTELVRESE